MENNNTNYELSDMITNRDIKVFMWDNLKRIPVAKMCEVDNEDQESINFRDGTNYKKPRYKISVQLF